jgi:hypothetical protein
MLRKTPFRLKLAILLFQKGQDKYLKIQRFEKLVFIATDYTNFTDAL